MRYYYYYYSSKLINREIETKGCIENSKNIPIQKRESKKELN